MKKYTKENTKIKKLLKKGNFSEKEINFMVDAVIASTSQTAKHFCRLYEGYNGPSGYAYDQKDRALEAIGFNSCLEERSICPDLFVRTDTWEGTTTELAEWLEQDVVPSQEKCSWSQYFAAWDTRYGVYLSPIAYMDCLSSDNGLLSGESDIARTDVGDKYLREIFGDEVNILNSEDINWGSRRKVRLSDKVIEEIIALLESGNEITE